MHWHSPPLVRVVHTKEPPWPKSASELYRPSDSCLSMKLAPTSADRGVSRTQRGESSTAVISGFLDWSRYFSLQVAPQLHSWGWLGPVPDPLLLGKSCSAEIRTRTFEYVARNWPLDDRSGRYACLWITYSIYRIPLGGGASAVGIATGYRPHGREVGVRIPVGSRIFTSPYRPDRLWGLLCSFPEGKVAGKWRYHSLK
jgi:hypothetical protein